MAARGTKIKVGFQSTGLPIAPVNVGAGQDGAALVAGAGDTAPTVGLNRAATTLSDLCNSTFGRRRSKRKKGDGSKTVNSTESAANKTKNKDVAAQRARAAASTELPKSGGPQVEIINGKIVVRESSLVVNQGSTAPVDYEEIEEGIHPTATYSSFSKRIYSSPWGIEETRRFYEALRMCGTDFSMLQVFFPGRTRQQLKKKFFREEKEHPELVKCALDSKLPLDLSPFEIHMVGLTATVTGPESIRDVGAAARERSTSSRSQKRDRSCSNELGEPSGDDTAVRIDRIGGESTATAMSSDDEDLVDV